MLTFLIHEKSIQLLERTFFVAKSRGLKCKVIFDEIYTELEKTIIFTNGSKQFKYIAKKLEEEIEIPYELLQNLGAFRIGAICFNTDKQLVTMWSEPLQVVGGTTDEEAESPSIYTLTEIEQIRVQKQDKLTSGKGIKIEDNVISAIGGGEGGQGENGEDGFSPIVEIFPIENGYTISITDKNGINSFNIYNGVDGEQGIQGPQGEKGEKGDTGEQGPIGLQGEPGKDAITDQTYNPESENAQSGKAVADAMAYKQDAFAGVTISDGNVTVTSNGDDTIAFVGKRLVLRGEERGLGLSSGNGEITLDGCKLSYLASPIQPHQATNKEYVDGLVGDIETALDTIISIQENLIGGGSV